MDDEVNVNSNISDDKQDSESTISEAHKANLRNFLQRAETRLSTMHRIAGTFLGGAGLLVLFTPFYKDVIANNLDVISKINETRYGYKIFLSLILALIVALPLYSMYLLLKEIVQFYFTPTHPGNDTPKFYPRFILTGLTPPRDDRDEEILKVIVEYQKENLIHFIIPHNDKDKKYYEDLSKIPDIIPVERLKIIEALDENNNSYKKKTELKLFYTAFGIASVKDRTLVQEVARMEASLTRHANILRRLILRYMKSFLFFIWTSLSLVSIYDISLYLSEEFPKFYLISFGYLFWAGGAWLIVKLPIIWIHKLESKDRDVPIRDIHLTAFQNAILGFCILIGVLLIISITLYYLGV